MKTAIYKIEVEFYETPMNAPLTISKKEFNRQLSFLRQKVEESKDYEYPLQERPAQVFKHAHSTETVYHFKTGCADTYLSAYVCDKGYHFK